MKLSNRVIATVVAVGAMLAAVANSQAAVSADFSPTQQSAIQQIVHDYLIKNPQILVEMSHSLQDQEQKTMMDQAKVAINANAKKLFESASSPVVGNPKGSVTLVEFFDYQCIHCQESAPVIKELLQKNANLRVIFKEFPIFGSGSEYAAKAALAAAQQGKFAALHNALMAAHHKLSETTVLDIAKTAGLDVNQLKTDINSKAIGDELKANMQLAEAMHLMATPIFVIGKTPDGMYKNGKTFFIPGAIGIEALQNYIKQVNG